MTDKQLKLYLRRIVHNLRTIHDDIIAKMPQDLLDSVEKGEFVAMESFSIFIDELKEDIELLNFKENRDDSK